MDLGIDEVDDEWQWDDSIPWTVDVGIFAYAWIIYYVFAFLLAIGCAILMFCFYKNISDFLNTITCGLFSSVRSALKCFFGAIF